MWLQFWCFVCEILSLVANLFYWCFDSSWLTEETTISKALGNILHFFLTSATENNFLISQPKHMLWTLKRIVSMRRFF